MKRIEFIAPVEAMRGDLSGGNAQITYAGGKRAYDVTGSESVVAENYNKGYVGSKRLRNGKKFFSLKTKTQTNLGANSRLAMASFGGACSLARAAFGDLTLLSSLQAIFIAKREAGLIPQSMGKTNWLQTEVYPMLKGKVASITISQGSTSVTINNPWISGGSGTDVTIPQDVETKFDAVLSAA